MARAIQHKPTIASRRPTLAAGFIAALFFALLLPLINSGNLWHYDELLTGNRAREMLVRGDPFTVTLDFKPDFKKPPLQYWMSATALHFLPDHPELAVRLPSALYATLCLLAIAWLARRCFPDKPNLGLWTVLALASCAYFVHYSRIGLLDTGAAFHLTLAIAGCLLARRDPRWWWLVASQAILGAWQKIPIALAAWIVILAVRWISAKRNRTASNLFSKHLIAALIVSIVAIIAWPILQWLRYGASPINNAANEQLTKLINAHEPGTKSFEPYSYGWWLARDWALPGICAPLAIASVLWKRAKRTVAEQSLLEIGVICAVYGLVLLVMPYHSEHYLVPITPLLALLVMYWLRQIVARVPSRKSIQTLILASAILTALPVTAFHYFSASRSEFDLLCASRDLVNGLGVDEEIIIDNEAAENLNCAGFVSFYAHLHHAPAVFNHAQLQAFFASASSTHGDRNCRGICRRSDLPKESSPFLTRLFTQGDWVCWQHSAITK